MIGFVSQHGNIPKGYENRLRLVNGVSVQTTGYGEDSSMEQPRWLQNAKARYMTVEEFATALGISTRTVYRWVKTDRLKIRQVSPGGKILISIDALNPSSEPDDTAKREATGGTHYE